MLQQLAAGNQGLVLRDLGFEGGGRSPVNCVFVIQRMLDWGVRCRMCTPCLKTLHPKP